MMVNMERVSNDIIDLIKEHGSLTLAQIEEQLDASFNLIFMSIDSLVSKRLIAMKRQGMVYTLYLVSCGSIKG